MEFLEILQDDTVLRLRPPSSALERHPCDVKCVTACGISGDAQEVQAILKRRSLNVEETDGTEERRGLQWE